MVTFTPSPPSPVSPSLQYVHIIGYSYVSMIVSLVILFDPFYRLVVEGGVGGG